MSNRSQSEFGEAGQAIDSWDGQYLWATQRTVRIGSTSNSTRLSLGSCCNTKHSEQASKID
jgi:hypothetical protein